MDQYLAMTCIERAGAGRLLPSGSADKASVRSAMLELLRSAALAEGAAALGRIFAEYDCHRRFQTFLRQVLRAPQSSPLAS
jgi:UDP:flavonoid glycosyltransferase YjiC (YdhE family)